MTETFIPPFLIGFFIFALAANSLFSGARNFNEGNHLLGSMLCLACPFWLVYLGVFIAEQLQ